MLRILRSAKVQSPSIRRLISLPHDHDDVAVACWHCQQPCTSPCSFFCPSCSKVQPVAQRTVCSYFDYFQLSPHFGVNLSALEQQFWNLQKGLHPDRYGTHSEHEQELSAMNSTAVNTAYSTLKAPTSRVAYLLTLHNIDALSETSSHVPSPELLMHIMEMREAVEEAPDMNTVEELKVGVDEDYQACLNAVQVAYDAEEQDLTKVTEMAVRLKYLSTLQTEIQNRSDALE